MEKPGRKHLNQVTEAEVPLTGPGVDSVHDEQCQPKRRGGTFYEVSIMCFPKVSVSQSTKQG